MTSTAEKTSTALAEGPGPVGSRMRSFRLSSPAAFALQVSILVLFLAASSAPTPLYAVYQAEWGFSPITVTVVFGVYAVAVLTSLLTVGSLSDHIGRRPVLIAAIILQAAAMLVFATAGGVPALMVARVVQGLATGAAAGALGAGLLDLNKRKGTVANGVGAVAGTATGALLSGVLVQYLPAPAQLVFLVLFTAFVLQGVGVALMPESSTPKAGAFASLRPQLGLPTSARRHMLLAVPVLVAVWALAGFYGSLGPDPGASGVGLRLGGAGWPRAVRVGWERSVDGAARPRPGPAPCHVARHGCARRRCRHHVGRVGPDVDGGLLHRHCGRWSGFRGRIPGRAAHRAPACGPARAGRRAVDDLRRLLPCDGPAGRARRDTSWSTAGACWRRHASTAPSSSCWQRSPWWDSW